MTRTSIAAALITAALAVGLTACSSDDEATSAPTSTPTTSTSTAPTESAFGTDEFIADRLRTSTSAIVETVEQRGGTPQQAIAALVSSEAETGWQSGLRMSPPATDIRDIYGWRLFYNLPADSADVVRAATNTFMDNAATVTISADDPVAYALAVQYADPRGYNEKEHFYKKGETAAGEYPASLPKAQAAYEELRDSQ
ncbi:hypothetical protein J6397_27965 [Rhodococcus qingshengii]|jgi:hypothetical protein|uniref:hypothetical protein n=1 Tax=Rhodococcus TaxID=1827 RepID=UPI00136EAF55|nr:MULTISPECIES: hypothetical protein [Rhodococcus]MBP1053999.1 hypothetical protein [Rhodococcus qingshengii]MBP2527543.1 hypothetical protein [Rhodococcus sp. PvP104]MDA3637614.1 hypothetical protein [Rhodococcus sp. C-2]MYV31726.1 hypothetical protein [Rhodococcus erythropolis]